MTSDQFTAAQVALLCWRAAPTKSLDQLKAVAYVLRNRVSAGWDDSDWLAIVDHYTRHAASDPDCTYPTTASMAWRKFLVEFESIYQSVAPDNMSNGALYFCDPATVANPWFRANVVGRADTHPLVATVAPLLLFK